MKTIITICVGLLFAIAGCANFDWDAFTQGLQEYSRQEHERVYQRNLQLQENARDINRQLQRNAELNRQQNSWQERRAQQEYWKEYYRQAFPTDLFPFSR